MCEGNGAPMLLKPSVHVCANRIPNSLVHSQQLPAQNQAQYLAINLAENSLRMFSCSRSHRRGGAVYFVFASRIFYRTS